MINEAIWLAEKIHYWFGVPGIACIIFFGLITCLIIGLIKGVRYREIKKRQSPYTWPAEFYSRSRTKRWN